MLEVILDPSRGVTPEPHVAATIGTAYDAGLSVLVGEVEIVPHLRATQQKTGKN